jgi:transposase
MRGIKVAEVVEVKGEEQTVDSSSSGMISPKSKRALSSLTVSPDPEVLEKPERRRFTTEYKLRILNLADTCEKSGDLGALLRREGLYASNLNTWRHQREKGVLSGLTPKKRGRKKTIRNPLQADNERLNREIERLTNRLKRAELIIDVQKKISILLGIPMTAEEDIKY